MQSKSNENKILREEVVRKLREQGYRITKQRILIIDTLLEHRFECKKAVCYYVQQADPNIGMATVYRFLQVLEQMEVLKPENSYRVQLEESEKVEQKCTVIMNNNKKLVLKYAEWKKAIIELVEEKGYPALEIDRIIFY